MKVKGNKRLRMLSALLCIMFLTAIVGTGGFYEKAYATVGLNLSLTATASCDNPQATAEGNLEHINDGDYSTRCVTNAPVGREPDDSGDATYHWYILEWDEAQTMNTVWVYSGSTGSEGYQILNFTISYWTGSAWSEPIATVTNNTMDMYSGLYNDLTFRTISTTKIRMDVQKGGKDSHNPPAGITRLGDIQCYYDPELIFDSFSHDFEDYDSTPADINTTLFNGTTTTNSEVDYESGTEGNKVLKVTTTSEAAGFDMYYKSLESKLGTNKYQVYECAVKLPEGIPDLDTAYHQIQINRFANDYYGNNAGDSASYATIQNYKIREIGGVIAKKSDDTDFVFTPDQWYLVRRVVKFNTNPNTADTYVYDMEGNLLAAAHATNAGTVVLDETESYYTRSWRIHIDGAGMQGKTVMFDDINLYSLEEPTVVADDISNADVSIDIPVAFSQPVNTQDLTTSNITLNKGGVDVTNKISINNITETGCVVSLTGLDYESNYSLIFGEGIKSIDYGIPVAPRTVTISTKVTPFKVTSLKLYSGSEEVTGSPGLGSTIYAKALVDNNLQDVQDARVILALYKDGRLQGVAFSEPTEVAIGANEFEITTDDITVPASGCIAQMMVWDSLGDMHPLSEVTYIPTE